MTKWLAQSEVANPIDLLPLQRHDIRENGLEQDQAAGGREQRRVTRDDGSTTLGAVRVRQRANIGSRQVTATLRWTTSAGKKAEHWIGALGVMTRKAALSAAWRQVRDRSLLTPEGRQADRRARHDHRRAQT